MRTIAALLLLLVATAFAQSTQYAEPPLDETNQHNLDAVPGLDFYDNATALNGTVRIPIGASFREMPVSVSIEPVGFSVSVDNVTCPVDDLSFIALRGARMEHLTSLPNQGYGDFTCDREWFAQISDETAWRCDLDDDYCAEYENDSSVSYDINITFSFGNLSASVPFDSQAVRVPRAIVEAMRSGSGGNLTVALNGTVVFLYEINDRALGGSDCTANYVSETTAIPYSANRSFAVGGSGSLFFLRSPVLREQWAGDSRFDVVVLSQSPLYHADVYLNGNQARNITLRSFGVQENAYGLQEIVSQPMNQSSGIWSENTAGGLAQKALDARNRSFNYVYQFNYSYSGLGNSTLYLSVNDSCLVHSAYSDVLLSRMLSYNGSTMENGKPFDAAVARPSSPFSGDILGIITISFGVAAIIILVSFTNFWLLR